LGHKAIPLGKMAGTTGEIKKCWFHVVCGNQQKQNPESFAPVPGLFL
jgi:hypothetical protein